MAAVWSPDRAEALARLARFLPRAGRAYARHRNYDLGPGRHCHVSNLSPWIRHRLLTEQEVVDAVLGRHRFAVAEKFVQEVFWRTYWKGWLELRPGVWDDYLLAVRTQLDALEGASDRSRRWQQATTGRTGIGGFDEWACELLQTGYLHNHARMWFASIWIFTLELPWELGADFFLRHLLDGDPASNTLSWRWVAGLQTRGKNYLARADNMARYTNGRVDQTGRLAEDAPPLTAPPPSPPRRPPEPTPIDPGLATGLVLHEDDLAAEQLITGLPRLRGLAVLQATQRRSALPVADGVLSFVDGACGDAIARLGPHLDVDKPLRVRPDEVADMVDWARALGMEQIVTPYAPVGPTAAALQDAGSKLAAHGIRVHRLLRRWDQLAWPHATRGFFPFRAKIPAILAGLGAPATVEG